MLKKKTGSDKTVKNTTPVIAANGISCKGEVYKLGDGVFNTTWNPRLIVIESGVLTYFKQKDTGDKIREQMNLRRAFARLLPIFR